MSILVKIADGLNGKALELHEGATVADAVEASGYELGKKDITVNQSSGTEDTTLQDGDRIALTVAGKNNS